MPRLAEARQKLDAKDLTGATAIYEEVLASSGDRADVLVTISGDLGSTGHVASVIELIAPHYDATRHGPATGLNLLQAYLAAGNTGAAQHVLDILFALDRPELEDRLHGFSNAIADRIAHAVRQPVAAEGRPADSRSFSLATLSKPIWFFGLDELEAAILPPKSAGQRRIAFAHLSVPGAYRDLTTALEAPEDELGRLSRGIPLWLTEVFTFSKNYDPITAVGITEDLPGAKRHAIFGTEWSGENVRELVSTSDIPLDYVVTGALRHQAGDYELVLRLFEVKKFRERKTFAFRWTPHNEAEELGRIRTALTTFMEWSPAETGVKYGQPAALRPHIDRLAASLSYFLASKGLLAPALAAPPAVAAASEWAPSGEIEALSYLTLRSRARSLGTDPGPLPDLPKSPIVQSAKSTLEP